MIIGTVSIPRRKYETRNAPILIRLNISRDTVMDNQKIEIEHYQSQEQLIQQSETNLQKKQYQPPTRSKLSLKQKAVRKALM